MNESITIEIKPFLNGTGHIKFSHAKGKLHITTARTLPVYEYNALLHDLKKFIVPRMDLEKGKVWNENDNLLLRKQKTRKEAV